MKVALVDVNYGSGSTGKIVKDLQQSYIEHGHDVNVYFGRGPKSNEQNVYRISPKIEVYIHVILTRLTGLTGYFSPIATYRLIKHLKKINPDVVHLHELHGYYINIGKIIRYLKKVNKRVIWTFHCEFMYTGKCGYTYECAKFKSECKVCPQLKKYPKSLFFDFTRFMFNQKKKWLKDFDFVITTPSEWLKSKVEQSFLKEKEIKVIHNGIDQNIFYPRDNSEINLLKKKYNIPLDKKIVISVGSNIMTPEKGGRYFLKLANLMITYNNIHFVLIGTNKKDNVHPLNNLTVIDKTENQMELAGFYSMGDLFVLTSKKETFSLVIVESISCGTPVIGFDSGAPSEIVTSPYGQFSKYGDLKVLRNNIANLISFKQDKNTIRKTVDFAVSKYDKTKMGLNFNQLISTN